MNFITNLMFVRQKTADFFLQEGFPKSLQIFCSVLRLLVCEGDNLATQAREENKLNPL